MAEKEIKTEVETEETSNTFGGFNNKYVKGAFAAVIAAYAAKKDPYLLKGFAEKVDEFEKADRERRNKFIESATSAATTEIARNKLRRLERREDIAPKIKNAVENGMNPIVAGKAYKAGHLATLMKLKLANSSLDLNSLYKVSTEYDNVGNFSTNDVIEALTGPTLKLQNTFNNLKAPRRLSPISNLLSDGTDTSAQDEIQRNIDAQTPSSDDYKTIDYSNINVSELGEKALASMQKTRNITPTAIKSNFTKTLSNALGVKSKFLNGMYVFDSDDKINEGYGLQLADALSNEVENLITKQFLSPADAQTQVFNKYFKNVKNKGMVINKDLVGPDGLNILPAGWKPATPLGSNTGSGTGSGTKTLSSIKSDWLKKRAALLKQYGNNKGNKNYKKQIDIQGKAIQNQYKVLGGNIADIDVSY
jgi:hypothetical protein